MSSDDEYSCKKSPTNYSSNLWLNSETDEIASDCEKEKGCDGEYDQLNKLKSYSITFAVSMPRISLSSVKDLVNRLIRLIAKIKKGIATIEPSKTIHCLKHSSPEGFVLKSEKFSLSTCP